jgi:DNA-binding beta-propeller fold protein YncE
VAAVAAGGALQTVDTRNNTLIETTEVGREPLYVTVVGNTAWVTNYGSDSLSVVALG